MPVLTQQKREAEVLHSGHHRKHACGQPGGTTVSMPAGNLEGPPSAAVASILLVFSLKFAAGRALRTVLSLATREQPASLRASLSVQLAIV